MNSIDESAPELVRPIWRVVLITWLVTAAWDFVCATLLSVVGYHSTFARLWQGVASVPFGPSMLDSGTRGIAMGVLAHFCVALAWSSLFVIALVTFPKLRKAIVTWPGALGIAAIYGPIIWLVMSLGVIQIATGKSPTISSRWWLQVFAHIPFVALPLVFTARRFLTVRTTQ